MLLTLLETRTLPGFPEAPDPGPLAILVPTLLIPGLITILVFGLALGKRWLDRGVGDSTPATLPTGVDAEVLPSDAEIEADRALAHHAAEDLDPRGDIAPHRGKTDPLSVHY